MERCPACGSSRIYPSRLRSPVERIRHLLTGMQPYRCHQCDWRRWFRAEVRPRTSHGETFPDELRAPGRPHPAVRAPDLDQLDPP
jgi:hypothetical protein